MVDAENELKNDVKDLEDEIIDLDEELKDFDLGTYEKWSFTFSLCDIALIFVLLFALSYFDSLKIYMKF